MRWYIVTTKAAEPKAMSMTETLAVKRGELLSSSAMEDNDMIREMGMGGI